MNESIIRIISRFARRRAPLSIMCDFSTVGIMRPHTKSIVRVLAFANGVTFIFQRYVTIHDYQILTPTLFLSHESHESHASHAYHASQITFHTINQVVQSRVRRRKRTITIYPVNSVGIKINSNIDIDSMLPIIVPITTIDVLRCFLFLSVIIFLCTAALLQGTLLQLGMVRCRRTLEGWNAMLTNSSRRLV